MKPLRVLIGMEFSGRVRDAFTRLGHYAVSCDFRPSETPGRHYQGNVLDIIGDGWDLMIAHPECTYTCFAGIRWNTGNPEREQKTVEACDFFKVMWNADIPHICLEQPVSVVPRRTGIKWTQMVHPWQFGHPEEKKTCLYLKNLPPLMPTRIMEERESKIWKMSPSPDRSMRRSRTFTGIAEAMAAQWSNYLLLQQEQYI